MGLPASTWVLVDSLAMSSCMDARELGELEAAIVAHHEWLKQAGLHLRIPPDQLAAADLLHLSPATALTGDIGGVIGSLHTLCALRARARLKESRGALETARMAPPKGRDDAQRLSKQIQLVTDDGHFERLKLP